MDKTNKLTAFVLWSIFLFAVTCGFPIRCRTYRDVFIHLDVPY